MIPIYGNQVYIDSVCFQVDDMLGLLGKEGSSVAHIIVIHCAHQEFTGWYQYHIGNFVLVVNARSSLNLLTYL